ncbi:MAG: DUF58 domain-containing protein [bacterium]
MRKFIFFFIATLLIALFYPLSFLYYILYTFFAIYIFGNIWQRANYHNIEVQRKLSSGKIFHKENLAVELRIRNRGWLPVPWLKVQEHLPYQLSSTSDNIIQRVVALGSRGESDVNYQLTGHQRGIYKLGPLTLESGDIFGLDLWSKREDHRSSVTVYPRIVPIEELGIKPRQPFGNLKIKEMIFEDPSRIAGIREYRHIDSFNRINWKVSARAQKLYVKVYEPTISLGTSVILNLNLDDYRIRHSSYYIELGITAAASIAYYVHQKRQEIGLITNGVKKDEPPPEGKIIEIPVDKGYNQLMQILETLATLEPYDGLSMRGLLAKNFSFPYGTTLVVITPQVDDDIVHQLLLLRRKGYGVILLALGGGIDVKALEEDLANLGVMVHTITREETLKWMKDP